MQYVNTDTVSVFSPCHICHDVLFLNSTMPWKPVYSDQTFVFCETAISYARNSGTVF